MRRSRSPSISPPPRPQSLSDVEVATRKKAKEVEYNLEHFVGSGGFNCVYLTRTNELLRISVYDGANVANPKRTMVRNGILLAHLMSTRMRVFLGPSTLTSNSYNFFTQDQFQRHVKQVQILEQGNNSLVLCGPIQRTIAVVPAPDREFAIHHIEYIAGGALDDGPPDKTAPVMSADEFAFSCFSLFWYFYVAEAEIGFIHGDLKGANIMMRTYSEPTRFHFTLGDDVAFVFTSSFCPVVIDLDFAQTEQTQRQHRIGTSDYAPPEAMYADFMKIYETDERLITIVAMLHEVAYAYDWWSLGISIFELFLSHHRLGFFIFEISNNARASYADYMLHLFKAKFPQAQMDDARFKENASSLLLAMIITALVNDDDSMIAKTYFFFGPDVDFIIPNKEMLLEFTRHPRYMTVKRALREHMNPHLRSLLCSLLSWIPEARTQSSRPYLHLLSSYFAKFRSNEYDDTIAYKYGRFETLRDAIKTENNSYEMQDRIDALLAKYGTDTYPQINASLMCGTCTKIVPIASAMVCTCCSKVYCGKECRHE